MPTDDPGVPPRYRCLLRTYPAAWRREHAAAIVGLLLDLHAVQGRHRPDAIERIQFALDGLLVSARQMHRRRTTRRFTDAARRFTDAAALAGFHPFDQQNGLGPAPQMRSETEQARANARDDTAGGAMPQVSWGPIAFPN